MLLFVPRLVPAVVGGLARQFLSRPPRFLDILVARPLPVPRAHENSCAGSAYPPLSPPRNFIVR